MAEVLIPVVIDIEGAFDDAARRVDSAMRPLKDKIDTSDIQINIGFEGAEKELKSLSSLLKEINREIPGLTHNWAFDDLRNGIRNTKNELDKLYATIAHRGTPATAGESETMRNLRQAIIIMEQEVELRTKASRIAGEAAQRQINITRAIEDGNAALLVEANTIEQLNRKIAALRGKLNNISPDTQEWKDTATEIKIATAELSKYEKALNKIINPQYKRPPLLGSIDRINHEMAKLEKQWNAMGQSVKFDADGKLTAKADQLVKKYQDLARQAEKFGQSLKQAAGEAKSNTKGLNDELGKTESRIKSLITRSAYFFSLHTILRFLRNVREVTSEFELQRVALGGIIQDADKAESLFRQIKTAAIKSPFEIKDLVRFTKELSAYRVETDKLFDVTTRLADVSAGLGVDMSRLVLAYGQVRAASVLRGQELRQFTEAGIPLVDLLAKKFSKLRGEVVTTGEVFELISKRAVSFKMISEIFEDMTDKGGVFYKMQEKQAETLKGQWTNLRDALSIMYDEIGNTKVVHGAMERLISDAKSLMNNWRSVGTVMGTVAAQFAAIKFASLFFPVLTKNTILAEKATAALAKAEALEAMNAQKANLVRSVTIANLQRYSKYMTKAANATTIAGRGFKQLFANLAGGGWIGAVATALTIVGGLIASAVKEANRLNKELEKIDTEGSLSINRSVSNFKRLADAAVTAADGSKEQNEALAELQRTYGDILPSQDKMIEKLRELNGNYSSLTRAIEEKINMQIREQKINAATDYYANKITRGRKKAKGLLELYGLDSEQINAVMDAVQDAVNDGLIDINSNVFQRSEQFKKIIKDLTGIVVDFGNGFRDYEGVWHSVADQSDKAYNSLSSLADVYLKLDNETKAINRDMSSRVGQLGIYSRSLEDTQKKIDAVTVSFAGKYSFEDSKEEARQKVKIWQDALTDAFKNASIDISGAFDNGVIDFTSLLKSSSSNKQLQNYVTEIQKAYDGVVPSNKMVGVVERMAGKLADSIGLSMDDIRKYLLQGDKDMRTYVKDLHSSLTDARDEVSKLSLQKKDWEDFGFPYTQPDENEIKKAGDIVTFIEKLIGLLGTFEKETRTAYSQDPFIKNMQERVKFMKDFKKGYDDLSKYMSESTALSTISEKMLSRGLSMNISAADQKRAATDLMSWYEEAMNSAFEQAKKHGATGANYMEFLRQVINDKTNKGKALKDFQALIQFLFDAKTDLDLSEAEKSIKDALKKISEDIKRSGEANDFFKNILGVTGDQDFAANLTLSVYGTPGEDIKTRLQNEMLGTLASVKDLMSKADYDAMVGNITIFDLKEIRKQLDTLHPEIRDSFKKILDEEDKFSSSLVSKFANLITKYGDTEQKIGVINAKLADDIDTVRKSLEKVFDSKGISKNIIDSIISGTIDETELNKLPNEVQEIVRKAIATLSSLRSTAELEIFKNSEDYLKYFSELNVLTTKQASVVRKKLREAYLKAFHEGAISADELSRNLRAIDTQFKKLSKSAGLLGSYLSGGFDGLNDKLQEYADNISVLAEKMKSGKELDKSEQIFATKMLSQFGSGQTANIKSYQQLIEVFSKNGGGIQAAGEAFGQMGEGVSAMAANGPGALAIVDAIMKAVHATITGIQQIIDLLNEVRSEENKIGDWFKYISDFDKYTFSGWEKLKSGDAIGATVDAISAWVTIGTNAVKDNIKEYNNQIKEQSKLLDELNYQYSRLGVALEKSFGSDYIANYNQQMAVLQAQVAAYYEQARLEREKGKSADEETAKEYEKSAREIEDRIKDARDQISKFMSGTDLTSAAKDFAESWIEAYKQFGSTTDAMKEKFNNMIENMVVNSLAARLIQSILKPIFDQIDKASETGELSAADIAAISAQVPERVGMINDAMSVLMNQLTTAGINLREQATGMTGISRDIASASEESINGLAAGINTQNFYIQHIDMNVTAILAAMTGGATTSQAGTTGEYVDPYKDAMLGYAQHIPDIHETLSSILGALNSVITLNGNKRAIQVNM